MPLNRLRPSTQNPPKPKTKAKPKTKPKSKPTEPVAEPVYLNVYDLMRINGFTKNFGLGVYHTGIEVYGSEYGYAGHATQRSGIFRMTPRNHAELNESCCYNRSILLGVTPLTTTQVHQMIEELGQYFQGQYYHLTNFNCNHFSNALAQLLCGREIPSWVNRMANIVTVLPILKRLLPKDVINPPKYRRHRSPHSTASARRKNQ